MTVQTRQFKTEQGLELPGVSAEELRNLRAKLKDELGISSAQVAEAASYSMAMVIRYALGLFATDGRICALVNDSLTGWIALATLRHLNNAGATAYVLLIDNDTTTSPSSELEQQLKPLKAASKVEILQYTQMQDKEELRALFKSCHNVICGLYNIERCINPEEEELVTLLNELETPVHTIEAPLGIDVNSGKRSSNPLYASSTLSLGAPLIGLRAGSEYVGRHYICDISFASFFFNEEQQAMAKLFSEQPVCQIYSIKE